VLYGPLSNGVPSAYELSSIRLLGSADEAAAVGLTDPIARPREIPIVPRWFLLVTTREEWALCYVLRRRVT
jgi:hypothetical protein